MKVSHREVHQKRHPSHGACLRSTNPGPQPPLGDTGGGVPKDGCNRNRRAPTRHLWESFMYTRQPSGVVHASYKACARSRGSKNRKARTESISNDLRASQRHILVPVNGGSEAESLAKHTRALGHKRTQCGNQWIEGVVPELGLVTEMLVVSLP